MKKTTLVPIEVVTEIICDRCAKCVTKDCAGTDWYEMQSIAFTGGFDSIFGDGNNVSIDLCPQCLQDTLGQWLHIAPNQWMDGQRLENSENVGVAERISKRADIQKDIRECLKGSVLKYVKQRSIFS